MYKNPVPTVDVILRFVESGQIPDLTTPIVLIERKNKPFGWALPGGFVDEGERLENAARREVLEETSCECKLNELLYVYSDPSRDPRSHTVSTVFLGTSETPPEAGDDAAKAALFYLHQLPSEIAFDHRKILQDYEHFLRTGERPDPQYEYETAR
ncbi:MAG: NUDIX hydrolase [Leptospiraceae bacterium]|nr:NUDIX hydrolase [Leptospiraceae bacterium]